jgi:hypothetical protein
VRPVAGRGESLLDQVAAAAVPLVEDEVQNGGHPAQPLGADVAVRQLEPHVGGLESGFGPGQAALHRVVGDEEGSGDLRGGEAAERTKGQGDLRVERQSWVAAHKQQLEPLVGDLPHHLCTVCRTVGVGRNLRLE